MVPNGSVVSTVPLRMSLLLVSSHLLLNSDSVPEVQYSCQPHFTEEKLEAGLSDLKLCPGAASGRNNWDVLTCLLLQVCASSLTSYVFLATHHPLI